MFVHISNTIVTLKEGAAVEKKKNNKKTSLFGSLVHVYSKNWHYLTTVHP